MNPYFIHQASLHPSMQMQDAVKLCYQATFGAEHLLKDVSEAEAYFSCEYKSIPAGDGLLIEPISDEFCRVNLGVWKFKGLPPETLFHLFVQTAAVKHGTEAQMINLLNETLESLCYSKVPFDENSFKEYISEYLSNGIHAIHHSDSYREKEHPSYRLVLRSLINSYEDLPNERS